MAEHEPEFGHITVEIFGRETEVSAEALAAAEGTLGLAWCHESLSPADETALESAIDIIRRLRGLATPPVTPPTDLCRNCSYGNHADCANAYPGGPCCRCRGGPAEVRSSPATHIGRCRHEGGETDCPPSCLIVYGGCFAAALPEYDQHDHPQDCGGECG